MPNQKYFMQFVVIHGSEFFRHLSFIIWKILLSVKALYLPRGNSFPIFTRRHPSFFLKITVEITDIFISNRNCCLCDTHIRILQQFTRCTDASLIQVLRKRHADLSHEQTSKIIFTHIIVCCQKMKRQRFHII